MSRRAAPKANSTEARSAEGSPVTRWDETVDVVVVGCGYAGAVAALAAHDAGAQVLVLEKMPDPGGISACSFGGVRSAADAAAALAYLKRTNRDTAPDSVLRALAQGMTRLPLQVQKLARAAGATTSVRPSAANYPFVGNDTFAFVNIESVDDFDPARAYPHVHGAPGGVLLFEVLRRNLALRGIEVRTDSRVQRLLRGKVEALQGLEVRTGRSTRSVRARRGVVLACGGFEGDAAMQRAYWPEGAVLPAAFRGNTGDGIRMAQTLGADLWHMWHYHGSYGFRHVDAAYPFGIRDRKSVV